MLRMRRTHDTGAISIVHCGEFANAARVPGRKSCQDIRLPQPWVKYFSIDFLNCCIAREPMQPSWKPAADKLGMGKLLCRRITGGVPWWRAAARPIRKRDELPPLHLALLGTEKM